MEGETITIPFSKLDENTSAMTSMFLAVGSDKNIGLERVEIPETLKENLPSAFSDANDCIMLHLHDSENRVVVLILLPTELAHRLATLMFVLSSSWPIKIPTQGGETDEFQRRTGEQAVASFQEEGAEGDGSLPEPADKGVQNFPA